MVDGLGSLPAFPTFQRLLRSDNQKLIAKFQDRPTVDKEIQYFRDKAPKLESIDELFKDQRLLRFIASAYSLDEEVQYPARLRKVLESKVTDQNSLANRLRDPRYSEMSKELLLGDLGIISFSSTTLIDKVVNRYITSEYEKDLGKTNPALREASYFLRKVGSIKDSLTILGDSVLRSVVTFTLDLPPQIAFQSIDKQRSLIDQRIDVNKFKTGAGEASGIRSVDQAKQDVPAIDRGLKIASTAATQVQNVIARPHGHEGRLCARRQRPESQRPVRQRDPGPGGRGARADAHVGPSGGRPGRAQPDLAASAAHGRSSSPCRATAPTPATSRTTRPSSPTSRRRSTSPSPGPTTASTTRIRTAPARRRTCWTAACPSRSRRRSSRPAKRSASAARTSAACSPR